MMAVHLVIFSVVSIIGMIHVVKCGKNMYKVNTAGLLSPYTVQKRTACKVGGLVFRLILSARVLNIM